MTDVYLRRRIPSSISQTYNKVLYNINITLDPINDRIKQIEIKLTERGIAKYSYSQTKYDFDDLHTKIRSSTLTTLQKEKVLNYYKDLNPECHANLLNFTNDEIECGSYTFMCESEDLFCGIIEVLYSMRCMLFHGELVPNNDAKLCYEPAYRILKRLLALV